MIEKKTRHAERKWNQTKSREEGREGRSGAGGGGGFQGYEERETQQRSGAH